VHVIAGDVLVQRHQVDFLLVVGAQADAGLLADDGHRRHMIFLGIVQAVEQVHRAGAGGHHADAWLAGELGMGAGHE